MDQSLIGAEWRTDAQVGQTSSLSSEFFQPLDTRQMFFIARASSWNAAQSVSSAATSGLPSTTCAARTWRWTWERRSPTWRGRLGFVLGHQNRVALHRPGVPVAGWP